MTRLALLLVTPLLSGPLGAAETAPGRTVIWKFDDLKTGPRGNIQPMVARVVAWATEHRTPISFGIVTSTLPQATADDIAWLKANARENGGWVEFWHHGWTHARKTDAAGTTTAWEFKQADLVSQTASLRQGCQAMTAATGLTFHTFGAPNNAVDETTIAALDAVPELTVWFYGLKQDTRRTVIGRSLSLEVKVGVVEDAAFRTVYRKPVQSYLALQGHPPMWDDQSFTAFTTIAATLAADGWNAMTPSEFAATRPGTKPGN